jgi:hypothetical protein
VRWINDCYRQALYNFHYVEGSAVKGVLMVPVVGVFATRKEAEEAEECLSEKGLGQITLLTPDDWKDKLHKVRMEDMEQSGIGAALCGLIGGGLGVAAGLELGTLAAALLIAGADRAFAVELLGAAILGAAGAAAGTAAGRALEASLCDGLPKDDLCRYKGALRQGRSVVIAFTNDTPSAVAVRDVMARAGAENLDAAGKWWWWFGWRPAEEEHSRAEGLTSGVYCSLRLAFKRTFYPRQPE